MFQALFVKRPRRENREFASNVTVPVMNAMVLGLQNAPNVPNTTCLKSRAVKAHALIPDAWKRVGKAVVAFVEVNKMKPILVTIVRKLQAK